MKYGITPQTLATLNFVVTVATTQMTTVDLVVSSVTASDDTLESGQSFDLTATTNNRGTAASAATTLRFYRSTNTTISSSDTEIGTAAVSALAAGGTGSSVLTLTRPVHRWDLLLRRLCRSGVRGIQFPEQLFHCRARYRQRQPDAERGFRLG